MCQVNLIKEDYKASNRATMHLIFSSEILVNLPL
jgi:hypothetical protein